MKQKRYWLRGLIIGILFGILLTYAHEHVREFGHIFNINYDGVHAPLLFGWYLGFVQLLYSFSFYPFFFLGILTMFFQFFLPPITYGALGVLLGWAYGKFNKNIVVFLIIVLILFASLYFPLMRMASRSQWNQNYMPADNSTQIKRVQQ